MDLPQQSFRQYLQNQKVVVKTLIFLNSIIISALNSIVNLLAEYQTSVFEPRNRCCSDISLDLHFQVIWIFFLTKIGSGSVDYFWMYKRSSSKLVQVWAFQTTVYTQMRGNWNIFSVKLKQVESLNVDSFESRKCSSS